MRILLLRHGEPDYTIDSLTPKGHLEAELLSLRMAKMEIRDFYQSPLGRAQKTAEYTLRRMGREAETLPWLAEFRGRYIDPETGEEQLVWDRKTRYWTSFPECFDPDAWADIPPYRNGNARQIWEETKAGVDELMARYGFRKDGPVWLAEGNTTDTIAIFCHFAISMAVTAYLTDISPMILWHRTICLPSSLTELVTEERDRGEVTFRISKLGDLTHLESYGEPRSVYGLYPECYNGIDSTDPRYNGMPQQVRC